MRLESSRRCGEPFSLSWMKRVSWTGKSLSWMPPSSRQKKGRGSRKDEAGQRNEVPGGGRWPGYSSGKLYPAPGGTSPAEIRLLENVMADIRVPKKGPGRPRTRPKRVIGDKGYDSDPHRKRLRKRGIDLLSPHRANHRNVNRQDDRLWDRYKRRYIVERTFAWLGNCRRLVVRYENHITMFLAFLELGIAMLTLKKCL
jgi:transposase